MKAKKAVPALPFRDFFSYGETADFLEKLAAARPHLCRLQSLGRSREGRAIPLLTVTDFDSGVPEDRPGYLIIGNIHAGELSGTHAALFTARELLARRSRPDLLARVAFYIVPRLNPDGAEFVATTAGVLRSRTDRSQKVPNTLYQEDVNGDGLILTMRQEHADGQFVKDSRDERLVVKRRADSGGPFYRLLPEGYIHAWDGSDQVQERGRSFDWNRNWSCDWRPEPEQEGAGDFPFSEPEMHHLARFIHSRPNLFGVLGYHTGAAAVLRPPSTGADADLDEADLRVFEELAGIASEETGFPAIPATGYHHASSGDLNLRGHFHNFGYHHLGLFIFEFELGTMRNSAGISTQEQLAAKNEMDLEKHLRQVLKWWDRSNRRGPLFQEWKPFDHPQLGPLEIGGFLFHRLGNPALADLRRIARSTYRFTLEHAGRHPSICIEDLAVEAVGGQVFRIRGRVANRGVLPTHVTEKGRSLRRLQPVRVEFHPGKGVALLSRQAHAVLGHLDGVTGSRAVEWFLSARGRSAHLGEIRVRGGTGGSVHRAVKKPDSRSRP